MENQANQVNGNNGQQEAVPQPIDILGKFSDIRLIFIVALVGLAFMALIYFFRINVDVAAIGLFILAAGVIMACSYSYMLYDQQFPKVDCLVEDSPDVMGYRVKWRTKNNQIIPRASIFQLILNPEKYYGIDMNEFVKSKKYEAGKWVYHGHLIVNKVFIPLGHEELKTINVDNDKELADFIRKKMQLSTKTGTFFIPYEDHKVFSHIEKNPGLFIEAFRIVEILGENAWKAAKTAALSINPMQMALALFVPFLLGSIVSGLFNYLDSQYQQQTNQMIISGMNAQIAANAQAQNNTIQTSVLINDTVHTLAKIRGVTP